MILQNISRFFIGNIITFLDNKLKNWIFPLLAVLTIVIFFSFSWLVNQTSSFGEGYYDFMLNHRLLPKKPSQDIVIIEIDNHSIDNMSDSFGLWPWPRSVFADILQFINQQQAKAIVFNILFHHIDVENIYEDQYFSQVVKEHNNSFFPMVRFDSELDTMSNVPLQSILYAIGAENSKKTNANIAIALPIVFNNIYMEKRFGLANVFQDQDGLLRYFQIYQQEAEAKIPYLPTTVAEYLNIKIPSQEKILINWNGKKYHYTTISFYELYQDFIQGQNLEQWQKVFKNKIVILGINSLGKNNLQATPMDITHNGNVILANVIDNLMQQDYYYDFPVITYQLIAIVFILILTFMLFRHNKTLEEIDIFFIVSQITALVAAYLFLNIFNIYIDMLIAVGLTSFYFLIARSYILLLRAQRKGNPWLSKKIKNIKVVALSIQSERKLEDKINPSTQKALQIFMNKLKSKTRRIEKGSLYTHPFEDFQPFQTTVSDNFYIFWFAPCEDKTLFNHVKAFGEQIKTDILENKPLFPYQFHITLQSKDLDQDDFDIESHVYHFISYVFAKPEVEEFMVNEEENIRYCVLQK